MIPQRIRAIPHKVKVTGSLLAGREALLMSWATQGVIKHNWGDKLNEWMGEKISGLEVIHREEIYPYPPRPIHYWIGSHLATACADPNAIVWGAGCISETVPLAGRPREICAVRGWLSNERLKKAGLPAPDVVGDAALLLPRLYKPKRELERKALGVIPHCFEWDEEFYRKTRDWEDARVIDICGGIEEVIEQIVACDRIISSSLHGIICADAYGVPAIWLHASDKPVGDGFKFRDYFSSVGRPDRDPIIVDAGTERSALEDRFHDYRVAIDLDALWAACPVPPVMAG
ncbi:polysaccharide pyruvyl transferase family protein [Novosphingobium jiangmenense]|uniref:Polysaccharide pyruvyl transferase family protein n=1 Tax=Novosphingobium jiangmenense TaxID=2791981 RepID=A0ABS0HBK0_9SPHN|nr:polysaccharide pyruvyl transferase family protein [Novosphingobium jiangmenense]MBF9149655.1 polysaccharide pyruvyl transferase family protein [Novosphingobium jiangmenense]